MKYEIIKDKEDLYVLTINNIVVLISRDISKITDEIHSDVENRKTNPRRTYKPAIIDVELPVKEDKPVTKPTKTVIKSTKDIWGDLFKD